AIIHQELNLVPELSVADNIFLGREKLIAGLIVDRKASSRAADALLRRLGIELDPQARVGALRVGEQQLVDIAKPLSMSARPLRASAAPVAGSCSRSRICRCRSPMPMAGER